MFGPYQGTLLSPEEHETMKKSSYAWKVLDSTHQEIVGYIDPGPEPDPSTHWMAYIKSACYEGIVFTARSILLFT